MCVKVRSVFVSDIHLGTPDSKAEELLTFIKALECEHFFLIGDIVDGWALKRRWNWPQAHSDVIQKVLRMARKGTQVYYVLGNHDEFVRPFLPLELGDNLHIDNEFSFEGKNGKTYLISHGDFFDAITMTKRWLAIIGDIGYAMLLRVNRPINKMRKLIGYKRFWSLSKYIKENVKKSVMFITDFENVLATEAKKRHFNGVICGHIHKAEIREINDIVYLNCGDWVESCSAIIEHLDGRFEVYEFWQEHLESQPV